MPGGGGDATGVDDHAGCPHSCAKFNRCPRHGDMAFQPWLIHQIDGMGRMNHNRQLVAPQDRLHLAHTGRIQLAVDDHIQPPRCQFHRVAADSHIVGQQFIKGVEVAVGKSGGVKANVGDDRLSHGSLSFPFTQQPKSDYSAPALFRDRAAGWRCNGHRLGPCAIRCGSRCCAWGGR